MLMMAGSSIHRQYSIKITVHNIVRDDVNAIGFGHIPRAPDHSACDPCILPAVIVYLEVKSLISSLPHTSCEA
jgi:hypothetical protein